MWLRARRLVGWGAPAEEALALARSYFFVVATMPFLAVFVVGFLALRIWHETPQFIADPSTLQLFAKDAALCLGLGLLFLVAGLFSQRRGRRAEASLPQLIYGRCFRVFEAYANSGTGQKREQKLSARARRPVPLYLFVLVGSTRESARWYLLPSDWNDAVPEADEQVTLEIEPYTDFEIRLNEKNQAQLLASRAPTDHSQPAKPSRRERRETKRAILRAGRGWGMTAAEAAKALRPMLWITPLMLGALALLIAGVLFADWIVYRILAGAFALSVVWAVVELVVIDYRLIQAWRRARRSPGPEQTVEGVITRVASANPSADEDEQRTIIWLTRADGAPTAFVLRPRLYDGALLVGQRVRIQYLPPNDVVVAVHLTAESAHEPTSDTHSS
jgi:hypothetical protein